MAYTYLITGATSDVGAALIRHLLTEAPGEDRTILAQGCGDLARLDALVQQFPGRIVTFDADLSSPEAVAEAEIKAVITNQDGKRVTRGIIKAGLAK